MSSADGDDGRDGTFHKRGLSDQGLDTMLFESLVHHLIEKGLLTKNDALSVVQTVAEVKHGQALSSGSDDHSCDPELAILRRLFDSFAAMRDGRGARNGDADNIRLLRPPLHADKPAFPDED